MLLFCCKLFHARRDFEIILIPHGGLLHFHVMPVGSVDAPVGSQSEVPGGLRPPQQQQWIMGIIQVFSKMFWMIFCCSHFQQEFLNVMTVYFFPAFVFLPCSPVWMLLPQGKGFRGFNNWLEFFSFYSLPFFFFFYDCIFKWHVYKCGPHFQNKVYH